MPSEKGWNMDGMDGKKANNDDREEISEAEKTRLINEILDYEFGPEIRDRVWTDREIAQAESTKRCTTHSRRCS
jgi:hypothetical protein